MKTSQQSNIVQQTKGTFTCYSCSKSYDSNPFECDQCWTKYCKNCSSCCDEFDGCMQCNDEKGSPIIESAKPQSIQVFKDINLNNKQQLADIRIIQKNLIYLIGLSPKISEEILLKKYEYLGQYGAIQKLIVIKSHQFNPPSNAAYITYNSEKEASLAILAFESLPIYELTIRASFGTTKYCSYFLKGQQCPKIKECVYLHAHPKDKESQILKKDEMNNNKWLFQYSQKIASQNAIKNIEDILIIRAKNRLQKVKTFFPSVEELVEKLIQQNHITKEKINEIENSDKNQKAKQKKNTKQATRVFVPLPSLSFSNDQDYSQKLEISAQKKNIDGNSTDSIDSEDMKNSNNTENFTEDLEKKIIDTIFKMNDKQAKSRFPFTTKKVKDREEKDPVDQLKQWVVEQQQK